MRSTESGRWYRWLLGVLLVVAGMMLHQGAAYAQEAERPVPSAEAPIAAGPEAVPVVQASNGPVEKAAQIITNPVVAALLIAIGVLLLLADLFTVGFGPAGVMGIGLLAIFFWGHFQAGLAGWESVALVALGGALLGLEIVVIPGFGVAGVAGLIALMGGLFLSLIGDHNVTREAIVRAGSTIGLSVITVVAGAGALLWLLPQLPWLRELVLQTHLPVPETDGGRDSVILGAVLARDRESARVRDVARDSNALVGSVGVALSDLRPSGFARIDGMRVDVVSRGEYIVEGTPLEVIADEGYRRVVRRMAHGDAGISDVHASDVR